MEERRFIGESHSPGKDPQILDGGDEAVLDALTSEPAPTRPLEPMIDCRFPEVSFLEPLASLPVEPAPE